MEHSLIGLQLVIRDQFCIQFQPTSDPTMEQTHAESNATLELLDNTLDIHETMTALPTSFAKPKERNQFGNQVENKSNATVVNHQSEQFYLIVHQRVRSTLFVRRNVQMEMKANGELDVQRRKENIIGTLFMIKSSPPAHKLTLGLTF